MPATNSLVNLLMSAHDAKMPTVGEGATFLYWTDRAAGTVIEVSGNGLEIKVQKDTATRVDKLGMSDCQTYEFSPNPEGAVETFTFRKNKCWVTKGQPMATGQRCSVGHRSHHHDYTF